MSDKPTVCRAGSDLYDQYEYMFHVDGLSEKQIQGIVDTLRRHRISFSTNVEFQTILAHNLEESLFNTLFGADQWSLKILSTDNALKKVEDKIYSTTPVRYIG